MKMNLDFPDQCSFRTSLLAPSLDDETEVKTIRTFFQRGGKTLDCNVKNAIN